MNNDNSKEVEFANLSGKTKIHITSQMSKIDFLIEDIMIEIYLNNDITPIDTLYSSPYIFDKKQPHGKSFEIPDRANKMKLRITGSNQNSLNLLILKAV